MTLSWAASDPSLPERPPASDPHFIPAKAFTVEGTARRALAEAFSAYAKVHGGGTQAEFLATPEGARPKELADAE